MRTVHTIKDLRATLKQQRTEEKRIALVPTMGNLHQGHLALVKRGLEIADYVVTSIFVNPMQFGAGEDLDRYPKTLIKDQQLLEEAGNHLVFAPSVNEIYPKGMAQQTQVLVPGLTEQHCGASRPGHFVGVATVVTLLFNTAQPDIAIFGQKDFQQLAVIRKMVKDLFIPVQIEGVATVREPSGLAMSSRNGSLSEEERQQAAMLLPILKKCSLELQNNSLGINAIEQSAKIELLKKSLRCDYVNIVNSETLKPAKIGDQLLTILIAVYLGNTRLIDNISIKLKDGLAH